MRKTTHSFYRHLFGSTGTVGDALTVVDAHFVGNQCGTFVSLRSILILSTLSFSLAPCPDPDILFDSSQRRF